MKFSYYPGCTLKTKAKKLDKYAVKSAEKLGVSLKEQEEWQCCGGVYPLVKDEIATKLSSVRVLVNAKESNTDLVTVCSACHNVIKRVNNDFKTNEDFAKKANNYLNLKDPYDGETKVFHYLEMLKYKIGFNTIKDKVNSSMNGKKIAAYYGCLLLRPSNIMELDDPENPTIMEDFIKAIGASPVIYSERNECCGAYMAIKNKDYVRKRREKILLSAKEKKADMIITACPLCMYNLKKDESKVDIPIYYFTEILAESLGIK